MRRCGRSLVQRVSLTLARGELLALCGPEGSGTRTLLHVLSGHLRPDAGRVLVDGRERDRVRVAGPAGRSRPDPRRLGSGPEEAVTLLGGAQDDAVLLLERPVAGLDSARADDLLATARHRADDGAAVVLTVDEPDSVATVASTLAVFVAGRLLSWGAPAVALVPAVHILGADQAGSIMTSST